MDAVIFDLDGVLMYSEPAHGVAIAQACSAHDVPFDIASAIGLADADAIEQAFHKAGREFDVELRTALLAEKHEIMLAVIAGGHVRPYEGAIELVREASQLMPVGVCSAGIRAEVTALLRLAGLLEHVGEVVAFEDAQRSKPNADPYLEICRRMRVTPGQCVAIEDSVCGLTSALAAGCNVIAVGHTTFVVCPDGAHRFVRHIADLHTDDFVMDSIE